MGWGKNSNRVLLWQMLQSLSFQRVLSATTRNNLLAKKRSKVNRDAVFWPCYSKAVVFKRDGNDKAVVLGAQENLSCGIRHVHERTS